MDEPTAALGPAETAQVRELVAQLKAEGIGIFLISHDIHDVFDLADRISVMLQGKLVGTVDKNKVTKDEVLAMIIIGKLPEEVSETEMAEPPPPDRAPRGHGGGGDWGASCRPRRQTSGVEAMAACRARSGRATM